MYTFTITINFKSDINNIFNFWNTYPQLAEMDHQSITYIFGQVNDSIIDFGNISPSDSGWFGWMNRASFVIEPMFGENKLGWVNDAQTILDGEIALKLTAGPWKSPSFSHKYHQNGGFSRAMLV